MIGQQAPLVKVIIAGASQVGKTSLIHNYVFEEFIEVSPTIGINFAQKIGLGVKGPLNLSIWDLSGENRFQFLMPQFCSGAIGVILVCDLTRPATLEEAIVWLDIVHQCAHPSHHKAVILAGNKADLMPRITDTEVHQFCKGYEIAGYIECSAKTGRNVDQLFERLCSVIQNSLPEFCQPPRQYTQVL
ncbi:MAG: Rab family GTPase [Promethearchaeota archaeon]